MADSQPAFDFTEALPPAVSDKIAEGMKRADQNADGRWKREMDAAIRQVALSLSEFTADDVVAELERNQFHFETHNPSALGPRLTEVAKTLAYMEKTDRVQRSKRKQSNGNLLRVWRSLLYRRAE